MAKATSLSLSGASGMVSAYHGGDLWLRTAGSAAGFSEQSAPDSGSDAPGWLTRALTDAATHGPEIWVDRTVLRCCNQAYEIAIAHRSREVRLEHLVHAMTLVPGAVQMLQSAGISDATLRRESGIILAQDVPGDGNAGQYMPQTSAELQDVLRNAAANAYRHRSPVTIDDILETLFDMKRETSTRNLLSRHREDWTLREPASGSRGFAEGGRDRVRSGDTPTATDTVQNSRIDDLERTVAELLAIIQKQTSGEAAAVAREPAPDRASGSRDVSHLQDVEPIRKYLSDVEASVDNKFRELARTWNVLGERLQTLEDMLLEQDGSSATALSEASPVLKRLVERLDRLAALEDLPGRLEHLETIVKRLSQFELAFAKLGRGEHLESIEDAAKKLARVESSFSQVHSRLDGIETRLDRGSAVGDMGILAEAITELRSDLADRNLGLAAIREQVKDVESSVTTTRSQLSAELRSVSGTVAAQQSLADRLRATLEQGLRNVGASGGDGGRTAETVRRSISEGITKLQEVVQQDRADQRERFDGIAAGIERTATEHRDSLSEIHEALLQLNGNQQTLARSMDQWRADITNELSSLAARLQSVEQIVDAPLRSIDALHERLDAVGTMTQERTSEYHLTSEQQVRPESFAMWLFGTERWWSDGWRSSEDRAANGDHKH